MTNLRIVDHGYSLGRSAGLSPLGSWQKGEPCGSQNIWHDLLLQYIYFRVIVTLHGIDNSSRVDAICLTAPLFLIFPVWFLVHYERSKSVIRSDFHLSPSSQYAKITLDVFRSGRHYFNENAVINIHPLLQSSERYDSRCSDIFRCLFCFIMHLPRFSTESLLFTSRTFIFNRQCQVFRFPRLRNLPQVFSCRAFEYSYVPSQSTYALRHVR